MGMLSIIADALMVATRQDPFRDRRHDRPVEAAHERKSRRSFDLLAGIRN